MKNSEPRSCATWDNFFSKGPLHPRSEALPSWHLRPGEVSSMEFWNRAMLRIACNKTVDQLKDCEGASRVCADPHEAFSTFRFVRPVLTCFDATYIDIRCIHKALNCKWKALDTKASQSATLRLSASRLKIWISGCFSRRSRTCTGTKVNHDSRCPLTVTQPQSQSHTHSGNLIKVEIKRIKTTSHVCPSLQNTCSINMLLVFQWFRYLGLCPVANCPRIGGVVHPIHAVIYNTGLTCLILSHVMPC